GKGPGGGHGHADAHGHAAAHDDHGHGGGHGGGHGVSHAAPPAIIGIVACGTVLLSFLTAVFAILQARHAEEHTLVETLWSWIPAGVGGSAVSTAAFGVDWAYQVDPLSSVMLLVV